MVSPCWATSEALSSRVRVEYAAARFANASVDGSVLVVNCCVLKLLLNCLTGQVKLSSHKGDIQWPQHKQSQPSRPEADNPIRSIRASGSPSSTWLGRSEARST